MKLVNIAKIWENLFANTIHNIVKWVIFHDGYEGSTRVGTKKRPNSNMKAIGESYEGSKEEIYEWDKVIRAAEDGNDK